MMLSIMILMCLAGHVIPQDVINNYCYGSPTPPKPDTELVGFSVASNSQFSSSTWVRVPMAVIHYNDGGFYHTDDNSFHAPVNGVYFFTFSGHSTKGSGVSLHLYTQKPGIGKPKILVARAADSATPNSYSGSAASVMVKMVKGETASLWIAPNHILQSNSAPWGPTTLFTGKLEKRLD